MKVIAIILRINPIQLVGEKKFKVQEIHVKTVEQYEQVLSIQFTQEKTDLLANFQPGQKVSIDVNLRGREVIKEGKEPAVYNSINGWKIEKLES